MSACFQYIAVVFQWFLSNLTDKLLSYSQWMVESQQAEVLLWWDPRSQRHPLISDKHLLVSLSLILRSHGTDYQKLLISVLFRSGSLWTSLMITFVSESLTLIISCCGNWNTQWWNWWTTRGQCGPLSSQHATVQTNFDFLTTNKHSERLQGSNWTNTKKSPKLRHASFSSNTFVSIFLHTEELQTQMSGWSEKLS